MGDQVAVQTRESSAEGAEQVPQEAEKTSVESELLVEEVSIDGMCGVY
jgi:mycofactocin precursor